jgi:hypothetical protein
MARRAATAVVIEWYLGPAHTGPFLWADGHDEAGRFDSAPDAALSINCEVVKKSRSSDVSTLDGRPGELVHLSPSPVERLPSNGRCHSVVEHRHTVNGATYGST